MWDPNLAGIASPDERGWAQELSAFLDADVAVANYADSGETAGAFYGKFFGPALSALREGDYVFVQFGHNDQKNPSDVDGYVDNLMRDVDAARDAGATPVLFTPVGRRSASRGNPGFEGLDERVREVATGEGVAFIDLTLLSIDAYAAADDLDAWFVDGTHFSSLGARRVAGIVAQALGESDLDLAAHLGE
jgi:lysophospholipase L1-like esterase